DFTLIINPWNPENYGAFRLGHSFQKLNAVILRSACDKGNNRYCDFFYSLKKLGLVRIFCLNFGNKFLNFLIYIIVFHKSGLMISTNLIFFPKLSVINLGIDKN